MTALRAYCINRLTRLVRPEHKRDKHMQPHRSFLTAPCLPPFVPLLEQCEMESVFRIHSLAHVLVFVSAIERIDT